MEFHVFKGGLFAVEAGILEDDSEGSPGFVFLDRGVKSIEFDFSAGRISRVVSILMVVVLPAPLGPRKAKISPVCDIEGNVFYRGEVAEFLD